MITAWRSHSWGFHYRKLLVCYTMKTEDLFSFSAVTLSSLSTAFLPLSSTPYRRSGRLPVHDVLESLFLFWFPFACVSSIIFFIFFFFACILALRWGNKMVVLWDGVPLALNSLRPVCTMKPLLLCNITFKAWVKCTSECIFILYSQPPAREP